MARLTQPTLKLVNNKNMIRGICSSSTLTYKGLTRSVHNRQSQTHILDEKKGGRNNSSFSLASNNSVIIDVPPMKASC